MNHSGNTLSGAVGQNYGNSAGLAAETQQAAEIPRFTDEIHKNVEGCAELLTMLEHRLSDVSRTDPPMAAAPHTRPIAVTQSKVGQRLQDLAERMVDINNRIEGIRRRLEV